MEWPELSIVPSDDPDPLDEEGDDAADETPRTVLITGARGNIGGKLRAAWQDFYDLVLIDLESGDDPDIIAGDLSTWDEDWVSAFDGVDTVIHLAADPSPLTPWAGLVGPNLDALANVFLAAGLAGVERVVFASSNHAMGGYKPLGDEPIDETLPPRPGNDYGAAKLVGERLGRSMAAAFDMTVVSLRLGWVQPGPNRPETLPDDWSRSIWLSDGDMLRLFSRAVEAEMEPGESIVVNGMSRNRGSRWSGKLAAEALGFIPEDDVYEAR